MRFNKLNEQSLINLKAGAMATTYQTRVLTGTDKTEDATDTITKLAA